MRISLAVGSIRGISIKIHINLLLTAILVTWSLAGGYFPQEYPGWASATYWTVAIITALFFFGSVFLHELGHSLIAQREGVPVNSIMLFVLGGIAHIAHEPETPEAEVRIVAAGPLTSLLLAVIFKLLSMLAFANPQIAGAALYLSHINFLLAIFNSIPGFPLDGGRILRAILWKWNHSFIRATRWASIIGIGIALLFVIGGIAIMALGNYMAGLWIAFIGWYLGITAQEGYRIAAENDPTASSQAGGESSPYPVSNFSSHPSARQPAELGSLPLVSLVEPDKISHFLSKNRRERTGRPPSPE